MEFLRRLRDWADPPNRPTQYPIRIVYRNGHSIFVWAEKFDVTRDSFGNIVKIDHEGVYPRIKHLDVSEIAAVFEGYFD